MTTLDDWTGAERRTSALKISAARDADAHHGQVKMALRLAATHTGRLMYVHGVGWLVHDGKVWRPDNTGIATRAVISTLGTALAETVGDREARKDVERCESAPGMRGVLEIAAALEPFAATVDDLDADPYLLNTPSGTLDLRTDELRPHDPADRITQMTRGAYVPGLVSPRWETFRTHVLPDPELCGFVQRLAGLGVVGTVPEHVLAIFTGQGANGKGTFDRAFGNALGSYSGTAEPDLLMPRTGAHPAGQMALMGKRWVVVSESNENRPMDEAVMKRLTGGDDITARFMGKNFVTFKPSHTVVLITNHPPKVHGDDPAVIRRLRVVPFDVVIPEAEWDRGLDEALALEADAILTWAVEGYRDYVARGGLDAPAAVRARTDAYRVDNDAVARFVAEECDVTPSVATETAAIHAAFERWCHAERIDPMSARTFGQALDRLGFPTSKANGKRMRKGIAAHLDPATTGADRMFP